VIETNLTTLDEPLANETTFGNEGAFGNDIAPLGNEALPDAPATNVGDPVTNAL
jgi:hypothetical protein